MAHDAGVVHRDVKPSNLVLPGGDPRQVMLLDFGIARRTREERGLTQTGIIVGSCSYMSPEQALGRKDVDRRSDVFSLGCVLYETLTGTRAFAAMDAMAALAKILLDTPARLEDVAPHVPLALGALVMRMLEKDRSARPASAHAVAEELSAIAARPAASLPLPVASAPSLTRFEQRVVWVLLAAAGDYADTQVEASPPGREQTLEGVVRAHGGSVAFLADGAALVSFQGTGLPSDEAPRAAQCALAVRAILPGVPMAIAMGLGLVGQKALVGSVIDEAVRVVRHGPTHGIRVSGIGEGLLGAFELERDDVGLVLVGARDGASPSALRVAPLVGRERELLALEALYAESESEPKAVVAVLTAPAGGGKSRVREELLRRLASRDEPPTVLLGRADLMSSNSAFAPLADAVRRRAGIVPSQGLAVRREKIDGMARVVRDPVRARVVAEMIGELAGVPFPEDRSDLLRAARRDARLMGDHMRSAFEDWLSAECDAGPVVLVLEDMHWGDLPSIRFVDGALRNLSDKPLFVLALARPEIDQIFPDLWSARGVTTVALTPLSQRSAEQLVRSLTSPGMDDATLERIVDRAQGNAFFLEELVRAAERGLSELPDSVLGTVQARLVALTSETRRVLRAASVFGEAFSLDEVAALIGGEAASEIAARELVTLAEHAVVSRVAQGEYVFRHALVQEATYATLTAEDKTLGHRLAGELLEAKGTEDARALAEHFSRSDAPRRAAPHLQRAAAQALEGNDLARSVELAERALLLAPDASSQTRLHAIIAEAQRWRGEYPSSLEHSLAAIPGFEEGTASWFRAIAEYIAVCAHRRDFKGADPFLRRAMRVTPAADAVHAQVCCVARGCTQLLEGGRIAEIDDVVREMFEAHVDSPDDLSRAAVNSFLGMRALHVGDLGEFSVRIERCLAAFERIGEVRNTLTQRVNLAYAYAELGDLARAETALRRVLADAQHLGIRLVEAYALHNLGNVVRSLGRLDEGVACEKRAVDIAKAIGDPRIEGASRGYLARMLLDLGQPVEAEVEARHAAELLSKNPSLVAFARAGLARVLLAQGKLTEAAEESAQAAALLDGVAEDGETLIRLTRAQALRAVGDHEGSLRAIEIARDRLLERAARIRDATFRQGFLERVPESAETLRLAREWGA